MISSGNVIAYASEFSELDPETINLFIGYASLSVNQNAWRNKSDLATILMTCHMLRLRAMADASSASLASGPITSETVGGLSSSYGSYAGASGGESGSLGQTPYGAEFLRLQKSLFITPMVIA